MALTNCARFKAAADIDDTIATSADPFYMDYRVWDDDGNPTGNDMISYFGSEPSDFARAQQALDDGDLDQSKSEGGVRQGQCQAFVDYIALQAQAMADYNLTLAYLTSVNAAPAAGAPNLTMFETALRAMYSGRELTDSQRADLSGTLIAKVDIDASLAIANGQTERLLFVIPGRFVNRHGRRDLNDPLWHGVDEITRKTLDFVKVDLLNLDYAVQLRLGIKDQSPVMQPVTSAPGFVIMGGV